MDISELKFMTLLKEKLIELFLDLLPVNIEKENVKKIFIESDIYIRNLYG
jgi:hypothetical protein